MLRVVLVLATLAYPFIVYFGAGHVSPGVLAGLLAVLFIARAFALSTASALAPSADTTPAPGAPVTQLPRSVSRASRAVAWATALVVIGVALWVWLTNAAFALRLYPLIINVLMLILFAHSLIEPPPLIERIAVQRKMPVSDYNRGYLRGLTQVWVGFFCLNVVVSAWTIWFATLQTWLLYNGLVVYLLIGVLFVGEMIYRQVWQARYPHSETH